MATDPFVESLSSRGGAASASGSKMLVFSEVMNDLYSADTNPSGHVSLALAENILMHQEMEEYIANLHVRLVSHDLTYENGFLGSKRLRAAVSRFVNAHFQPLTPTNPSQIVMTAGVTNAIEVSAWSLGDPGDGFLLGRPYYTAFVNDIGVRAGLKTVTVSFGDVDPFGLEAVAEYEKALLKSIEEGTRIKGLILCSPHNPLGRCYPRHTLIALLKLCQQYQIHLISDEIYALSVFTNSEYPNAEPFTSVLSIDLAGVIDPHLVHVLWGMSKDFGANGLRLGCIISQGNPSFLSCLGSICIFTFVSSATDYIAARIFEDDSFTSSYLATNSQRMAESYAFINKFLRSHSIPFYPGANAAFFIWCDLKGYQRSKRRNNTHNEIVRASGTPDADDDQTIMKKLLAKKVFISSGAAFGAEADGWYRIVFTYPRPYLEEGLNRMVEALE